MYKILCLLLLFFPLLNPVVFSQTLKTTKIHYRIIEDKIEIFYDLPDNQDSLTITVVFRKKSNPEFKYWPKFIDGDVGLGVFAGENKKITWYFKKEPEHLFTGSDFYFKIYAKKILKKASSDSTHFNGSSKH
jgi:hypothetical protein